MSRCGLVIHGGAGAIRKDKMTPQLEAEYRSALNDIIRTGFGVLEADGVAIDAVERAVRMMEDSPLFNAGKGSVFTYAETNEMDAAIMNGRTRDVGAVCGVQRIKNPITLARAVMEKSPHVLLARDGAEMFARGHGIEFADDKYFFTERRWKQMRELKAKSTESQATALSEQMEADDKPSGTVGAVALDKNGDLAAATSTGGMANTQHGRVGDTPIIGAGTYADNETCAVSATGEGEHIIRGVIAHDIATLMSYRGMTLVQAADVAVFEHLASLGGSGGVVAIDARGNVAMPFNSLGMYRGYLMDGYEPHVAIWEN
jgi:beta-aspartyl-peptidase (threonine type)